MKVLWHSGAPWAGTGYGVQTALFAPRLKAAGHDVSMSSTWGLSGDTLEWRDMLVYPGDGRYGNATLGPLIDREKPDVCITLLDVWVLKGEAMRGKNLACWTPIDHDPCPPSVVKFFKDSGARPIAMSRFGEKALRAAELDPLYVPHGVDTAVFQYAGNREEIRDKLGLPQSAFIVGMVANNQGHTPPRKAFPQALQAFAAFRQKHPDAMLYLHTEVSGKRGQGMNEGVDLLNLLDAFEVPVSAVAWTDQLQMELGIPSDHMVGIYNSMDVLLNPSYGEGFGVPIIEAQACGTPVIVTNWTSMPELVGAGWVVDGENFWHAAANGGGDAFWASPSVEGIFNALEQAHAARGDENYRQRARKFALEYDADKVFSDYWVPALEVLGRPREVAPLNRAMRRAAQKAAA